MKYDAVVVASGKGKRAKLGFNKVFFVMSNGKTVLENACHLFVEDKDCKQIIVVTNEKEKVFKNEKLVVVKGGKERFHSVMNGLNLVKSDYVFIHDGARPYLEKKDLCRLKNSLKENDGAILATKATDTIKYSDDGYVNKTIDRNKIYMAQTPQAFKSDLIKKAYQKGDCRNCTDDASVFEKARYKVKLVEGSVLNKKLTLESDFK